MAVSMTRTHPLAPIFRPESGAWYQTSMEKRQLFLRSYQFSRKQSLGERIKRSFLRVKRVVFARIRAARRVRKVVWSGLRQALCNKRKGLARVMNCCCCCNGRKKKYEYFYVSPSATCFC